MRIPTSLMNPKLTIRTSFACHLQSAFGSSPKEWCRRRDQCCGSRARTVQFDHPGISGGHIRANNRRVVFHLAKLRAEWTPGGTLENTWRSDVFSLLSLPAGWPANTIEKPPRSDWKALRRAEARRRPEESPTTKLRTDELLFVVLVDRRSISSRPKPRQSPAPQRRRVLISFGGPNGNGDSFHGSGYAAGGGKTPSCVINPRASMIIRVSMMRPASSPCRWEAMPHTRTCRPVAGTPRNSPLSCRSIQSGSLLCRFRRSAL